MQISERVARQYRCQICGTCPTEGGRRLVLDHDHSVFPKKARGLLCHRCNLGLGVIEKWMRENIHNIAIEYVVSHGFENPSEGIQ